MSAIINRFRFIALLFGMLFSLEAAAYTIELSKAELQEYADAYFPLQQATPFSKLTYSKPTVVLNPKTNRIGLEVTLRAEMPGMIPVEGRGQIDGELEYRNETKQFYLHDPKLNNIRFANTDYQLAKTIQQMVSNISQQALPVIFVYELKDEDLREKMAKSVLKSATVHNGKLVLDVTLPF